MANPTMNATVINIARHQYYFSHWISLFIAYFSIAVCILEQEVYLEHGFTKRNDFRFRLLWLHWILTFILCITILISYKLYINLLNTEHRLFASDGLLISGLWRPLLVEICINLIAPIPRLYKYKYSDSYGGHYNKIETYSNSMLLFCCLLIRSYHVILVYLESSHFMTSRSFRVCKSMGKTCDYKFAIRCIFKAHSLQMLGLIIFTSAFLFGYVVRIIEVPINYLHPKKAQFSFPNSMWSAIVTMTTVGYGDIFPYSGTGKYIGLFSSFVGICLTAFSLVSLKEFLTLTESEETTCKLLVNIKSREALREKARLHIVTHVKANFRRTAKGKEILQRTLPWYKRISISCRCRILDERKYSNYFRRFRRANHDFIANWEQSKTESDFHIKAVEETYKELKCIKDLSQALLVYVDKKKVSKDRISELKKQFVIPNPKDRINQYVTPADFSMNPMSSERGGEYDTPLNVSFGE